MRWMNGWSYADLMAAPERVVRRIMALMAEQGGRERDG